MVRTLLSETSGSGSPLGNEREEERMPWVFSEASALRDVAVGNGIAGKCFPRGKGEFLGGLHRAWAAVQV